jgi:uncharacterized protein YdgA (DUF945 family)
MANAGVKVAVVAGVVGGVVAIHSWWIGEAVEQRFRSAVGAVEANLGYRVSLERYERGVFTSEAETLLELPLPPPASEDLGRLLPSSLRLRMLHRISHGPGLDGLRSARILSTPSFDGEEAARLREIYGELAPFSVRTDFGYGDEATIELRSPPVETKIAGAAPIAIEWSGIEGDLTTSGGRLGGRVFAPKLLLRGESANFGMAALSWTMDLTRTSDGAFWIGDAEVTAASIDLSLPTAQLQVFRPALRSKTAAEGSVTSSTGSLTADRIVTSGVAIERPQLRLRFDRIDAVALTKIGETLRRRGDEPATTLAALDAALVDVRPMVDRLVALRPELRIEELSFRLADGPVQASGFLRYIGDGALADFTPADLEGDASVALPPPMLDFVAMSVAATQAAAGAISATPATLPERAVIERAAGELREEWRREKYFETDADRIRTRVELREGRVLLNGRTVGGSS